MFKYLIEQKLSNYVQITFFEYINTFTKQYLR